MLTCAAAHRIKGINKIVGSATYIAPGIFITAKHAVDEWHQESVGGNRFARAEDQDKDKETNYESDVLQILKDNSALAVWRIRKAHLIPGSDLGSDNTAARKVANIDAKFTINLHPPRPEETIDVFGFPNTINKHLYDQKSEHNLNLTRSHGIVEDLLPRGNGMVKPSCIQANVNILGGMSGGPATNSLGELVGINSSEYDLGQDNSSHLSFISLLWPAFGTKIYLPQFGITTLYKMATQGFLSVKELEHIEVEDDIIKWRVAAENCPECNVRIAH